MTVQNILVIKLSALGDFIQALGPMAAIKKHHQNAKITLLTTKGFKKFAKQCGYFDEIWIDDRPKFYNLPAISIFRKKLNNAKFDRIYDLQNNDRTCGYFKLLTKPRVEWVGTAKGASHCNSSQQRTKGHAFDGHVQTLALAGIDNVQVDQLEWMDADISEYNLPADFAVIVPGCSAAHPYKRWPAEQYANLANELLKNAITPVLIGTVEDKDATDAIKAYCPEAINLNSKTSLAQIATLGRSAKITIGNDTGPMHLIGATGRPCVSLFCGKTHPIKHAPKGDNVHVLQENDLSDLLLEHVMEIVTPIIC